MRLVARLLRLNAERLRSGQLLVYRVRQCFQVLAGLDTNPEDASGARRGKEAEAAEGDRCCRAGHTSQSALHRFYVLLAHLADELERDVKCLRFHPARLRG